MGERAMQRVWPISSTPTLHFSKPVSDPSDRTHRGLKSPQSLSSKFIAVIGETMIDKSGARVWAEIALAKYSRSFIETVMNRWVGRYASELLALAGTENGPLSAKSMTTKDNRVVKYAANLIRKHTAEIARYFYLNATTAPKVTRSMAALFHNLANLVTAELDLATAELNQARTISTKTRANRIQAHSSQRSIPPSEAAQPSNYRDDYLEDWLSNDGDDNLDEAERSVDGAALHKFLVLGEPIQVLAITIRRAFYYRDKTGMEWIEAGVLSALNSKRFLFGREVSFQVRWDLLGFLRSQFGDHVPQIGSLLVLTGSALYAQATTCSDYLQTVWPRSGAFFLSTLQAAVESSPTIDVCGKTRSATGKSCFSSPCPLHAL